MVFNMTNNLYIHDTGICDDSVLSNKNCTIPMSTFTGALGYEAGESILAIGRA